MNSEDSNSDILAKKNSRGALRSLLPRLSRTDGAFRLVAGLTHGGQRLVRWLGPERGPAVFSRLALMAAPMVSETRLARANIAAAFPEIPAAEREAILRGAWDNLARTTAEMTMMAELARQRERFEIVGLENLLALRDDGRPGIMFTAHLANWELIGIIGALNGLPLTGLYRPPTNPYVAKELLAMRETLMGPMIANTPGAALRLMQLLKHGGHICLMVDQRPVEGVEALFFGRPVLANELVARLARAFRSPVTSVRPIRLPDTRFRLEISPPIELTKDDEGRVDVAAATQQMTAIVEGWIRDYPEQWLWHHNRWGARGGS